MNQSNIKKAQETDVPRIKVLLFQLGYELSLSKIKAMVSKSGTSDEDIFVAIQDEEVIAVMSLIYFNYFHSGEKLCRITAIVVDESKRGSGIGTSLIDYAKMRAQAKKCHILELTTGALREKTITFYENIGFQKTALKYEQKLYGDI